MVDGEGRVDQRVVGALHSPFLFRRARYPHAGCERDLGPSDPQTLPGSVVPSRPRAGRVIYLHRSGIDHPWPSVRTCARP
jgi:hypothetical protein